MTSGNGAPTEAWADVRDLRMRYLDWGGDGPMLLALHGLASSGHWYDLVAPLLRDRFRIIAPDQRGHGQTTNAPTGYDWQSLSDDLAALLDLLEAPEVFVIGHSWGGHVSSNFAAHYPQRVKRQVMIDGGISGRPLVPRAYLGGLLDTPGPTERLGRP